MLQGTSTVITVDFENNVEYFEYNMTDASADAWKLNLFGFKIATLTTKTTTNPGTSSSTPSVTHSPKNSSNKQIQQTNLALIFICSSFLICLAANK